MFLSVENSGRLENVKSFLLLTGAEVSCPWGGDQPEFLALVLPNE